MNSYERFSYATGFKSIDRAEIALEHYYALGEVDDSDLPRIERYQNGKGLVRYAISLAGIGR
jgi:hypothetical protein